MSKLLLQKEGIYESAGISGGNYGYDFEVGGEDITELVRDALGIVGHKEVLRPGYNPAYHGDVMISTLKVRVTVEILEGSVQ